MECARARDVNRRVYPPTGLLACADEAGTMAVKAVIIAGVDVAAKAGLDVYAQEPPVLLPVSKEHRLPIVDTLSSPVFDDVFGILG